MDREKRKQLKRFERFSWKKQLFLVIAALIVFATTYALILPAITIDEETANNMPGIVLDDNGKGASVSDGGDTVGSAPSEGSDSWNSKAVSPGSLLRGGTQGSILTGTIDSANEWQIVSNEYVGNSSAYKTVTSDDGHLRIQKNVIPTGTENEFLVYISVDGKVESISTKETITDLLSNINNGLAVWWAAKSPHGGGAVPDELEEGGRGSNQPVNGGGGNGVNGVLCKSPNDQGGGPATSGDDAIQFRLWYDGQLIADPLLSLDVPNSTMFLKVGNEFICLDTIRTNKNPWQFANGDPIPRVDGHYVIDVYLTEMSFNTLINRVSTETSEETSVLILDQGNGNEVTITDNMGDYIVFDGLAYTNSDVTGIYPPATVPGTTVQWQIDPKEDALESEHTTESPQTSFLYTYQNSDGSTYQTTIPLPDIEPIQVKETTVTITTWWDYNVVEIVYKVHLDVTKEGFASGTVYDVNGPTKLNYWHDGVSQYVTFPVPQVKGTLYDFAFTKVDQNNTVLAGATFTLTGPAGNQDVSGTYVNKTLTSNSDGLVSAENLPWGTYTLTETVPPSGYSVPSPNSWSLTIGRTEWPSFITPIDDDNDIYNYTADWKVVNTENTVTVKKAPVFIGDTTNVTDFTHSFYIALWSNTLNDYFRVNGQIVKKQVTVSFNSGGELVASPETVTFDKVPSGEWQVWEISDANGTSLVQNGIVYQNGSDKIQLFMENGGLFTVPTANTPAVTATNTYTLLGENRNAVFYKQWALNDGTPTTPPEGAAVTYKLFSKTETGDYTAVLDEENNPVTITLTAADQVEGNTTRWKATFEDLPSVDNDGHHLSYYVQETSYTPDYFRPFISDSAANPMTDADYEGEGGAIVNKNQTTDITIKKVVDGPDADQDISFSFTASLPEGTDFPEQNAQDVTVSGSTVTFSLKHSEEVVLTDLPIGIELSVAETVDGTVFTTTAAGRTDGTYTDSTKTYSCTVIEETGAIVFTNTHKQGVLRLIKNVTGDEPYQLSERSFIFNVSGPSYPLTETEEDGETVTSGGTTVPITVRKSGNSWTGYVDLTNVYVGTYTVSEDEGSADFIGYVLQMDPEGEQNVEVTAENTTTDPASVTITNTYEQIKEDVIFYKSWIDDDDAAGYRYNVSQFTAILNLDNGVEGADVPNNIRPTITELEEGGSIWKITYSDMPSYANGVQTAYSLTEDPVYQYSTTYTNEDSGETSKALPDGTIVNKLIKTDLMLLKVDAKDETKTLSGVQFKLLRANDGNEIPTSYTIGSENGIYVTDSDGKIQFNLPDGYYTLKEIETADGYIIDTSDFGFSIVLGVVTGDQVTSASSSEGDVTTTTYTITIPNTPGAALPNTGGEGTWAFTAFGAVFLLIGVFFGCVVRYRGRRFDY